jgi:hypothetical protein
MSSNLKDKEIDDTITNANPSGNINSKIIFRKEDLKNRKKTRLVNEIFYNFL